MSTSSCKFQLYNTQISGVALSTTGSDASTCNHIKINNAAKVLIDSLTLSNLDQPGVTTETFLYTAYSGVSITV